MHSFGRFFSGRDSQETTESILDSKYRRWGVNGVGLGKFIMNEHNIRYSPVVKRGGKYEGKIYITVTGPKALKSAPVRGYKVLYADSVDDVKRCVSRYLNY